MATEQRGFCEGSLTASADLRTKQYCYVKMSGAGTVDVCSASTDKPLGILQNKPNTGEVADIMITGRSKVLAGAAVATAGTDLMSDATGRAIAATGSGNMAMGRNVTVAAAAAVVLEVELPGVQRAIP